MEIKKEGEGEVRLERGRKNTERRSEKRKPAYKKPVVWLVQIPIQADGITTDLASGASGVQSLVLFFHRFKGC